jgi:hypothetical protein
MPGDRVPYGHYLSTAWKRPVRRWRVDTGDPHTGHHVTLLESPGSPAEWRWLVHSSLWSDLDVWGYPAVKGAMARIRWLERTRCPWTWAEVAPTPYDTELGTMPGE